MATAPPNNNPPPSQNPDPQIPVGFGPATPLETQVSQQEQISILQDQIVDIGVPVNGILGGLPVAEKNQEYFLVINEAGDTSPEIIDQTQFKITYLCDSQLNVSKPSGDGIALANVTQNFERQKNAVVRIDQGTVLNNQLAGTHKITAVGSFEPIAGTQIGKGPLDYVTTMSFVPIDQLGAAPGLTVASYYIWLNKTPGFQNLRLSTKTEGSFSFDGNSDTFENLLVSQSNATVPFRPYMDTEQIESGSAVGRSAEVPSTGTPGLNPASGFNPLAYFNKIIINTGSIEGRTRIKLRGSAHFNVVSSSVYDLFTSAQYGPEGTNDGEVQLSQAVKLSLKHKTAAGVVTEVASQIKSIPLYNPSLRSPSGYFDAAKALAFSTGDTSNAVFNDIGGFKHKANGSATYLGVDSEFFSVEVGDSLYLEAFLLNMGGEVEQIYRSGINDAHFSSSINNWKNELLYRQINYFGGHMIVLQETPQGQEFENGITGVTASYYTTGSTGFVSQSIFNNTGSYFIGYNNFTTSQGNNESFITASTPLTLFYGNTYYQVNPGTETYNTQNASITINTSLGTGADKKTWNNFGFNPLKNTFSPKAGDFIRFEYSKSKVFQILQVTSNNNVLKLKLDGHIPLGTVIDNFIIYRIVEDGQFIVLNVKKNSEIGVDQIFTGLCLPQYPSSTLQEKSNTLIFELKQSGIIEN
jgi:hypothetical protein